MSKFVSELSCYACYTKTHTDTTSASGIIILLIGAESVRSACVVSQHCNPGFSRGGSRMAAWRALQCSVSHRALSGSEGSYAERHGVESVERSYAERHGVECGAARSGAERSVAELCGTAQSVAARRGALCSM